MKDEIQEEYIKQDYKVWRKNVSHLYDLMFSTTLDWPSLSVQYFPDVSRDEDSGKTTQRLLLTTNTSGADQEYVHIAAVDFPDKYDEDMSDDFRGDMRFKIVQSLPVVSTPNIARYHPKAWHVIATKHDTSDVYIFDYTKHLSTCNKSEPEIVLQGHTAGGFGLAWNPTADARLASAGNDCTVCIFDIADETKCMQPQATLQTHNGSINEVCFSYHAKSTVVSVSDDKTICIWDTRTQTPSQTKDNAHDTDILSVDLSPICPFYLATASRDQSVKIWDMRNMSRQHNVLLGHTDAVNKVRWSPHAEGMLASGSDDRRVCLWDLSKSNHVYEDSNPPELMFIHGGHTDTVFDLSWNPAELFEIVSVAEDNVLQIWQLPETE